MANLERDQTPRYAPAEVLILEGKGGRLYPVQQYVSYPPGTAPAKCPIRPEYTTLELRTAGGSRWYGVDCAWINAELRMVIQGTNPRDEVRMAWEVVPGELR